MTWQVHSHRRGVCITSPGAGKSLPLSLDSSGRASTPISSNASLGFTYYPPTITAIRPVIPNLGKYPKGYCDTLLFLSPLRGRCRREACYECLILVGVVAMLSVCPWYLVHVGYRATGRFNITVVGTSFTLESFVTVSGRECKVDTSSRTQRQVWRALQRTLSASSVGPRLWDLMRAFVGTLTSPLPRPPPFDGLMDGPVSACRWRARCRPTSGEGTLWWSPLRAKPLPPSTLTTTARW